MIDINSASKADIALILSDLGLSDFGEIKSMSRAGDGNMNVTLRILGQNSSVILKQAFPYCAKFPDIAAPIDRLSVEASFYRVCSTSPRLRACHPQLFGELPRLHILALEDLGTAGDYENQFYTGESFTSKDLNSLGDYLSLLHSHPVDREKFPILSNKSMRELNSEYLFIAPFEKPSVEGLPSSLGQEIRRIAQGRKDHHQIVETLRRLRKIYLNEEGKSLLHGDFYPRSWIRTTNGPKIIDMEFCFFGPPEFDLGVLQAHLALADSPLLGQVRENYCGRSQIDWRLTELFQAQEIMRRILGLAKVNLAATPQTIVPILEKAFNILAQAQ